MHKGFGVEPPAEDAITTLLISMKTQTAEDAAEDDPWPLLEAGRARGAELEV